MPLLLEGGNGLQNGPNAVTGLASLKTGACPRGSSKLCAWFKSREDQWESQSFSLAESNRGKNAGNHRIAEDLSLQYHLRETCLLGPSSEPSLLNLKGAVSGMTSAVKQIQLERLLIVYRRVEEVLYGSVYPLQVNASEAPVEIPLGKWKSPFIVSKQVGEHEIVYGSVLHHMHEAARPIFRIGALQNELAKSLPSEIRASMVVSRSGNEVTYTSPEGGFPPLFIYQQDEIIKDAVLLSVSHVRTLMEILGGKGNRIMSTYDYEGNPTTGVSMQQLCHALSHHRNCVVSGGFICDIFSGQDTRGLPDMFGTKIKVEELMRKVIEFLEGITINDFVGVLRGKLQALNIDSKPRDVIFVHQNVYALTEVVRYRLAESSFLPFRNYLFSQLTADESRELVAAGKKSAVRLERRFNLPRFKVGSDLDAKVIETSITINEKQEKFELSQQDFFEKLTATCGNESMISVERLRQRIESLSEPG